MTMVMGATGGSEQDPGETPEHLPALRLLDLPPRALDAILGCLPVDDLGRLMAGCSALRTAASESAQWERAVEALDSINTLYRVYGLEQFADKSDADMRSIVRSSSPDDDLRFGYDLYRDGARFSLWLRNNDPRAVLYRTREERDERAGSAHKQFCSTVRFCKLVRDNVHNASALMRNANILSLTFGHDPRAAYDAEELGWRRSKPREELPFDTVSRRLRGPDYESSDCDSDEEEDKQLAEDRARVFQAWAQLEIRHPGRFHLLMFIAALQLVESDMTSRMGPELNPTGSLLDVYTGERPEEARQQMAELLWDPTCGFSDEDSRPWQLWEDILLGPFLEGGCLRGVLLGSDEHLDRLAEQWPLPRGLFSPPLVLQLSLLGFLLDKDFMDEKKAANPGPSRSPAAHNKGEEQGAPRCCWTPGCSRPGLKRCSRCKAARYCSAECQLAHWRAGHRLECVMKAGAAASS